MPDFEKKALDFTEAFAVDIIVATRINGECSGICPRCGMRRTSNVLGQCLVSEVLQSAWAGACPLALS
jgi:hypothetical protein